MFFFNGNYQSTRLFVFLLHLNNWRNKEKNKREDNQILNLWNKYEITLWAKWKNKINYKLSW